MSKIYIPAKKPDDWEPLLARPEQWKKGHSAWALAHSWQDAEGFPEKLRLVFVNSGLQLFRTLELLFAFPEYTVALPGRGQSSHNDIMAIAKGNGQIVVIAVEGKAEEEFGPTVKQWVGGSRRNQNRRKRLAYLLNRLALNERHVQDVPYQLLHRAVCALIEADRLCAANALMLVHSFSQNDTGLDEYQAFVSLFGLSAKPELVVGPTVVNNMSLHFAWAKGDPKYLA